MYDFCFLHLVVYGLLNIAKVLYFCVFRAFTANRNVSLFFSLFKKKVWSVPKKNAKKTHKKVLICFVSLFLLIFCVFSLYYDNKWHKPIIEKRKRQHLKLVYRSRPNSSRNCLNQILRWLRPKLPLIRRFRTALTFLHTPITCVVFCL